MTARQAFGKAFNRVVIGLGLAWNDDLFEECWKQVASFDAALFDEAAGRLLGITVWMPRPAEWVGACRNLVAVHERAAQEEAEKAAAEYRRRGARFCGRCADTGFRPSDGRPGYVRRCECRSENPMLQARSHMAGTQSEAGAGDDNE